MLPSPPRAAFLSAKGYGTAAPALTAPIPATGWPNWQKVVIPGVVVTNGPTVGVYSTGTGGQWLSVEMVTLTRQ